MADKTQDTVPAIGPLTGQGAPPSTAGAAQRQPPPSRDVVSVPGRDSVQISDAARAAASRLQAPPPARDNGSGKPSNGDLRFDYNPDTNTLQAQIVDANGKTISEIPTDAQIKARQQLSEFFNKQTRPKDRQGPG